MDRPDRVGLGQRQQVVVAAQVARMVAEPVAAVAGLVEARSAWSIVPIAPSSTRIRSASMPSRAGRAGSRA